MSNRKGQGATEYLAILAMVLIVALVVILLLGFFPGLAGPARETQSSSYWSGAQPFSITSFAVNDTNVSLLLANRLAEELTLLEVRFDNYSINSTNVTFRAGEEKVVYGELNQSCGSGEGFTYEVMFIYNQSTFTRVQYGEKPLIGRCS